MTTTIATSIPAGFADGDRHGWMDRLCSNLAAMIAGRAAADLLESPLPEAAALAVLPSWLWAPPAVDVGAKSKARGGGTLSLPVRLCWLPSPVQLIGAEEPTALTWTGSGLGTQGTGVLECTPIPAALAEDEAPVSGGVDVAVPTRLSAPVYSRHELRSELNRLVEDGRMARWAIITDLEPYVTAAVASAARSAVNELGESDAVGLLDQPSLESLSDELLLGCDEGPGPVHRLLEKALVPTTFARVDPQRWFRVALSRDAEQALRRRISDPWVGPRIRAVARDLGTEDVDAVIAAYNRIHPGDRVAVQRVSAALSASVETILRDSRLASGHSDEAVGSHEDVVIEAVDKSRRASAVTGSIDKRADEQDSHAWRGSR